MEINEAALGAVERLSDRQRECLRMMSSGLAPKEVAAALNLSVETVHAHLKAARRTLGLTSSREAARLLGHIESVGTQPLVMGFPDRPTIPNSQDEVLEAPTRNRDEVRDHWSGAVPTVEDRRVERPRGRLDELTIVQRAVLLVLALMVVTIVLAGLVATAGSLQRLLWQIYFGR